MEDKAEILIDALEYVEANIAGPIAVEDVARHCYVSDSGLQKTFRYVFGMSVKEYIIRRRFSKAAALLIETDRTILDIAMEYGYSSAESFTRGFHKIWGINPKDFRKTRHFTGHTPKLSIPADSVRKELPMSVQYDITDLYEVINERKNNGYVCADLGHLLYINDNFGFEAGDAAILEMMKRLEDACAEDDLLLRVGGDEFVIFTASEGTDHALEIVSKVSAINDREIDFNGISIPVHIHIGAFTNSCKANVNCTELFSRIRDDIKDIHDGDSWDFT